MPSLLPLSPFFYCHPEPLFYCHPERSEGSLGAYAPRDDKKESLGITLRKMSPRTPFLLSPRAKRGVSTHNALQTNCVALFY